MGQRNSRDEPPMLAELSNWVTVAPNSTTSNATATVTITNVAPAEVTTATIAKWLNVEENGTIYFIPMWT